MKFETPDRRLTKAEWAVLSEAALDKAGDYRVLAGKFLNRDDPKTAEFYAKKADKISDVLIKLESEYFANHPEEKIKERRKK